MKPVDVKPSPYVDFNVEKNGKDPKYKIGYHERISRYRIIFVKGGTPNWP